MKKIILIFILAVFLIPTVILIPMPKTECVVAIDGNIQDNYQIYSESEFLFERTNVEEGDIYITEEFKKYEIEQVDDIKKTAKAKFIGTIKKPEVKINYGATKPIKTENKKIGLYLTHNDESYVPSDGYDSIYGKGGIHDVAKALKTSLEKKGINVTLDETLHIPHDNSAYSRSKPTAKALLSENNDAIFDIHRDATSRSFYYTNANGKERSKIRIVVGKSNPNFDKNFEFATTVFTIGNQLYPNLFVDIYCGKNEYNQTLTNKALIFEMGTHLIEKELVLKSLPLLADAINTAMYGTTIDEDGNLEIGGENDPSVNDHFNDTKSNTWLYVGLALGASALVTFSILSYVVVTNKRKAKNKT